ncbi:MAG: carboxypeptidase-like regulatory domain-containing protein, partial [Bacteroidota bacterium]
MQSMVNTKYPLLLLFFLAYFAVHGQNNATLNGTVRNDSGTALEAANVALEGTTIGTSTEADGTFKISNIPAGKYQLVVSSIGY